MKNYWFTVLLIFLSVWIYAQPGYPVDHSWNIIFKENYVGDRLATLTEKARYHYYFKNDREGADSIIRVPLAWSLNSDDLKIKYIRLLAQYGLLQNDFHAIENWIKAQNANKKSALYWWMTWLKVKKLKLEFNKKEGFAQTDALLVLANELQDSTLKGVAYLEKAGLHDIEKNKIDALRSFLLAKDILEHSESYEELYGLLSEMVYFYIAVDRYNEAEVAGKAQFDCISFIHQADSLYYIEVEFNQLYARFFQTKSESVLNKLEERIEWTGKKGIQFYNEFYLSVYRSHLISNGLFSRLKDFYLNKYPIEFEALKKSQRPLYLRMNAYFYELEGKIDTADAFWQATLKAYEYTNDPVKHANMHFRYAEFLYRHNQTSKAIRHLHQAIKLDHMGNNLSIQQQAVGLLKNIYRQKSNYDSAYYYQAMHFAIGDSVNKMNEQDKLVLAEVLYETSVRQREQEEKMRIQDIKISGFAVGFILFLMLSGITFYQYRQTRKEKRRSDELLLNILPESTAEELKEKGKTTALKYSGSTVMFADFVGFTHVAEKLEAAELVEEVDRFFSAFDKIMNDHGLEKIKTIGDAYMAVAGLPQGNTATALDAVYAAQDMIKAVIRLNDETPDMPTLRLRIGLHTGEVVAGVVGTKKFQFDIWGDAVNTAARMEQGSSPNKINISAITYNLIKHEIQCTHRGKVHAKNKGELDMYFVDLA